MFLDTPPVRNDVSQRYSRLPPLLHPLPHVIRDSYVNLSDFEIKFCGLPNFQNRISVGSHSSAGPRLMCALRLVLLTASS